MATRKKSAKKYSPNGLEGFSMHAGASEDSSQFAALTTAVAAGPAAFGAEIAAAPNDRAAAAMLIKLDPETAARSYLKEALASTDLPDLSDPVGESQGSEFKSLGTETLPLTGTRTVKFRQQLNKIPIYGSLVTVELDDANRLLALNSNLGNPEKVSQVAKISPAEALEVAAKHAGVKPGTSTSVPRLHYYFDPKTSKWRLVYIVEDVARAGTAKKQHARIASLTFDFIVDAQTGALVSQLPRTPSAATMGSGQDDGDQTRTFEISKGSGNKSLLRNPTLKIDTYDFAFQDVRLQPSKLPGTLISNPPTWNGAAVSAHANAEHVVGFLRQVLMRNNIDNAGGVVASSINCLYDGMSDGQVWENAVWHLGQMMYGQVRDASGALRTLARNVDIVAHEMFHGVTELTARLEYANESGALNESLSDIFGVIVSNYHEPNIRNWNWEVGEGLTRTGSPFRDMSDPTKFNQPAHMRDYVDLPNTRDGDYGGVHVNSGIHNFAMYKLTSAANGPGFLFTAKDVASLYYITVTQYLSRTSGFGDCLRGLRLAAGTW